MLRAALALVLVLVGLAVIPRFTDRPVDDCEGGIDVVEWNGGVYITEEIDPPPPPADGPLEGGTRPSGCGEDVPVPLRAVADVPTEVAVYRSRTMYANDRYRVVSRDGRLSYRRTNSRP